MHMQVERAKQAATIAREAAAAKEQQVKELAKDGARVDKDRWGTRLVAAAFVMQESGSLEEALPELLSVRHIRTARDRC